ncbi:hypothetical protein M8J76_004261 [Diaphorina citri]|nr:hypothetical protein M8J75_003944 [Diaphorina citri]KAI5719048.1 hypothetical protein M8J76_004261 [Diaphorina citri]
MGPIGTCEVFAGFHNASCLPPTWNQPMVSLGGHPQLNSPESHYLEPLAFSSNSILCSGSQVLGLNQSSIGIGLILSFVGANGRSI